MAVRRGPGIFRDKPKPAFVVNKHLAPVEHAFGERVAKTMGRVMTGQILEPSRNGSWNQFNVSPSHRASQFSRQLDTDFRMAGDTFAKIGYDFRRIFHGLDDHNPQPPGTPENPTCPTWYSGSFATEQMIFDCLLTGERQEDWPYEVFLEPRAKTNQPRHFVQGPAHESRGSDSICRFGWWTPWSTRGQISTQVQIEHRLGCRSSLSHWSISLATRAALGRYPISGAVRRVFWPWYQSLVDGSRVQFEVDRLLSGCFHREVKAWHVHSGKVNFGCDGFARHSHWGDVPPRVEPGGDMRSGKPWPMQRPVEVVYPDGFIEACLIPGRLYEYDLAALWLISAAESLGADGLRDLTPEVVIEAALFRYWNQHQGVYAYAHPDLGRNNEFTVETDWPMFPGFTPRWDRNPVGKRTFKDTWEPQRDGEAGELLAPDNLDQILKPAFSLEESLRLARLPLVRPEDLAGVSAPTLRGTAPLRQEGSDWGVPWLMQNLILLDRARQDAQVMFPAHVTWGLSDTFDRGENLVAAHLMAGGMSRSGKWYQVVERLAAKPDPVRSVREYLGGITTLSGEVPLWD